MTKIKVQYTDTQEYTAYVRYDDYADSPTDDGNFEIVTFGRGNLITDTDRDDYMSANPVTKWLKSGKAFYIDIYQHSGTSYSLAGEGAQCRFDTANHAGLIVFNDGYIKGVSKADRATYARGDLESYTDWANGQVFDVMIQDNSGEVVDCCGGLIGYQYAIESIYSNMQDTPRENIKIVEEF